MDVMLAVAIVTNLGNESEVLTIASGRSHSYLNHPPTSSDPISIDDNPVLSFQGRREL